MTRQSCIRNGDYAYADGFTILAETLYVIRVKIFVTDVSMSICLDVWLLKTVSQPRILRALARGGRVGWKLPYIEKIRALPGL